MKGPHKKQKKNKRKRRVNIEPKQKHPIDKQSYAPMAMAVFPELGGPAIKIAFPDIRPSWTILTIKPAAFLALPCPTMP
jgi:hypothetical protein